jgi:hypothetical protein
MEQTAIRGIVSVLQVTRAIPVQETVLVSLLIHVPARVDTLVLPATLGHVLELIKSHQVHAHPMELVSLQILVLVIQT